MSSDDSESDGEFEPKVSQNKNPKKRLSVERIYQKKSQLEHILLRPDTYIGSVEMETKQMWVFDEDIGMQLRDITYVPGLYKIFDEVLVNAADNKQRDKSMSSIRIDIDPEKNVITICNNGKGIPVTEHKDEKLFVPTLIFGHLLTSSNYDDKEKKVVGGRNGYGAKLCNIFSNKFKVETSCKEYKKAFSQVWTQNMKNTEEPKIIPSSGEDFTRVTFEPDLSKFSMTHLDKDIVALFSRRAYDIAGSSKGVKVFLNGKRLPINGFKDYIEHFIKDKEDETGNPLKITHEIVNDRWEIAVSVSDKGFQQNSFVNSIATTRGGKHVDYVADQIVSKITDIIKKKNKAGVNVKPFQIKNHLWVFVNCLIENPTFDSQTKETMTLQSKNFGSKCVPTDKFFVAINKIGVIESVMSWVKFKEQTELNKHCNSKKQSKLKGIPKLEDANDAGTKHSIDCTLILTEGDSAKTLVVAGFGVIGRDKYGVFPLRGKMLNVREATHKQIMENAEINNIIKIMGLQYKKNYSTPEDLKTLRYGKLMIMTDQDHDGSHIKGLLINFIHHNWPALLKLNFLEEFITPIVKVTKGNEVKSFYSLPEFEDWKKSISNWSSWKVKYYKGLGTSTSTEAKEYFQDIRRHRITFKHSGADDDRAVEMAFSKKLVEQRKDWLTNGMEERKRRRELGLSEMYLYESNIRSVSFKDFVDKELILFSNMDNERSIPSIMDGLKPGQRKVMFTCFKRNDKREVKVAQLAGSVGEHSAYHHGEVSLMSTIINLAQNFVGSNNINLLQPIGQFGTRLQGGKDAASPRYIFTMLSPLARKIFPPLDDPLLNSLFDDNMKIEPEYYAPIIPMVLVNGAEGIGTGWSTKIPNYNPIEIVENLRRMIRGEEIQPMLPWFKGFLGTIVKVDNQRFVVNGEIALLDEKSFEITELPIKTWTQTYKESALEILLHGNEKNQSLINDYKEYHTDATVRFVITLSEDNLNKSMESGIHKAFKLQTSLSTTSMVLFDHNGCLKRYESPEEILKEFFYVRLEFYVKRKAYYEGMLEAEALKLENQARFILEKIEGKLVMENVKKAEFVSKLIDRKFDSDPVKLWKLKNGINVKDNNNEQELSESEDNDDSDSQSHKKYDFGYLFDMTMRSMLREKVEELLKNRDIKKEELEALKKSTPQMLWDKDLNGFLEELKVVEEQERQLGMSSKPIKITAKGMAKTSKNKTTSDRLAFNSKPSSDGERIEPKIDFESYRKVTEKVIKKVNDKKKKNGENDGSDKEIIDCIDSEGDLEKPLSERTKKKGKSKPKSALITDFFTENNSAKSEQNSTENPKKKKTIKKTDNSPKKQKGVNSKTKKRNPWSDSDSDEEEIETIDSETESEGEDFVPKVNKKVINEKTKQKMQTKKVKKDNDYSSDEEIKAIESEAEMENNVPKVNKKKVLNENTKQIKETKQKTKKVKKDSDSSDDEPKKRKKTVKKVIVSSDSEDSEKTPPKKQKTTKKSAFSDSDEENIDLNEKIEARTLPSRARNTAKYVFSDEESA